MSTITTELLKDPKQQNHPEAFPLICASRSGGDDLADVLDWLSEEHVVLLSQLAKHGAILLRGFPVVSALDFDAFVAAFQLENFTYKDSLSNAVRRNLTQRVFTANEAPPSVSIFLHHEMAQTPAYPSKLFFFCERAPSVNGQTPLCRSDVLLQRLQQRAPEFVVSCAELGVRYSNVMPMEEDLESGQGRSWRSTLSIDDSNSDERSAAEEKLRSLGYQWRWQQDGSLQVTTPVLPAIRTLADGRRVFFNQLIAAFRGWKDERNDPQKTICFGDGSTIATEQMNIAIELADELSFDVAWQTGDVALVDNFLVMHGRRPYQGERRVLASLIANDEEENPADKPLKKH